MYLFLNIEHVATFNCGAPLQSNVILFKLRVLKMHSLNLTWCKKGKDLEPLDKPFYGFHLPQPNPKKCRLNSIISTMLWNLCNVSCCCAVLEKRGRREGAAWICVGVHCGMLLVVHTICYWTMNSIFISDLSSAPVLAEMPPGDG